MATKKILGVFLGNNYLNLVEVEKKKAVKQFTTSHSLFDLEPSSSLDQKIPTDIKLTALIQKSLRENQIESTDVFLSLPTRDIILRSFFIPWMTSEEVKGVVEFEINRYIPFKLDELAYTYHTSTVAENKTKRIRVLFVAVRKDILEKYCSVLEQADLKVTAIEPEPISLVRLLSYKKQIQTNQKTAIILFDKKEGTIIIVDQGIPQFVREFRLSLSAQGLPETESSVLKSRLFNEIRISLDYYARQHAKSNVDKILFLTSSPTPDLSESLTKDLGIFAQSVDIHSVIEMGGDVNLGFLNALGVGLKNSVPSAARIDLAKARLKETEEEYLEPKPIDMTMIAKIGGVCGAILLFSLLFTNRNIAAYTTKFKNMEKKQGAYEAFTIDQLRTKQKEVSEKLKTYQAIRFKSDVAFFLKRIPELLPTGVWLTSLSIDYKDAADYYRRNAAKAPKELKKPEINIIMDGYVYAENINQQINIVNRLPVSFRTDEEFFKFFSEANLVAAKKRTLDDYTVTYFQISLQ